MGGFGVGNSGAFWVQGLTVVIGGERGALGGRKILRLGNPCVLFASRPLTKILRLHLRRALGLSCSAEKLSKR